MTLLEWKKNRGLRRAAVVGVGISNLPLVDRLLAVGFSVTACDKKSREALGETADRLEAAGVRLSLGDGYLDGMGAPDVIFRSPGLRPDLPAFAQAAERGALLTSEMELFLELTPAHVIGISGSDGKTTTTTLTGLMLEAAAKRRGRGRVFVGGNIGEPLLPRLEEMTAEDVAVVELSSFQLQTLKRSPARSALTNITPNHLDWHRDMAEYIAAKTNIYAHVPNRLLVVNAENAVTAELGAGHGRSVIWFSSLRTRSELSGLMRAGDGAVWLDGDRVMLYDGERETAVLEAGEILLPGRHNLENYMTAIALTAGLVTPADIAAVAKGFTGVEHRLELVRVLDGVRYYNSSIDSTPTRTAAALSALGGHPIVICGGYDKQIPFAPLAEALAAHAKAVILTGATAEKIAAALEVCPTAIASGLRIYREDDFCRAVTLARELACEGDAVLLSPACASFDAFPNFRVRGEKFKEIVNHF